MSINNVSEDRLVYSLLKKGLDASTQRSKVISNNIANVNTSNFKRSYVTFEDSLQNSIDNLAMEKTDTKHMDDGTSYGQIQVKQDTTSSMNSDGNNVNIDAEMANEAQNTLMYDALESQVNSRLSMERYVITGGGK
ncbi:MAG: flagellar basal body rod protein FlgB [Bacillota bacterium]|nr:flagellar basal body rod protein FlgB [Bacillota bacterium]